jgi:two-component system phosphate regulon response regulator PhoB
MKPRILLVEDDLTLASLYQMRMETEGFEVQHCPNGEEALQAARDFKPDLILLDIMMPRMNGFDVLDIIRNTPETKDIKIVILSAMGQPEDQAKAKQLGANDYMVKSQVVIADVMDRLRRHLDLPAKPAGDTAPGQGGAA